MSNEINSQNIMSELNNIKNWKRTSKKNYDVYVCAPWVGTKVHNRLEGSNYVVDNNKRFVISGTVGEQWVVDLAKLSKTYCFMDGSPITNESLYKRVNERKLLDWQHIKTLPGGGGINWAFHLPLGIKNFPVNTSWGDTLYANRKGVGHGVGDFIVASDAGGQPNLNDVWVVNGEVFPTTYDMRAFPGLVPADKKVTETPVPAPLINKADTKTPEDAFRIKEFMKETALYLKDNNNYSSTVHDTKNGNLEEHGGYDLWTIMLHRNGERSAIIGFKDGKLTKGGTSLSIMINDLEVIKPTKIDSPEQAANLINKTLKSLGINGENKSRRIEYQIVGRYMTGSDVTGYHLQSIDTGKSGQFTRDQVCFLVGRGQITNCTAQLYNDKVLLRGNGIKLDDLPIIREDGELRNSDGLGKIRKGTSAVEAVEMFNIVGTIKAGNSVIGYVIQNAGGGIKRIKRPQLLQLADAGKIGNARVQNNNGEMMLRGVGVNIDELPSENVSAKNEA